MSKKTIATNPVRLSDVDFLIATFDNTPGLKRVLMSILDQYPTAKVTIGDSSERLDRAHYKALRAELSEAGLANRVIVHHLPYRSSQGRVFNKLVSVTSNRYKLLLTDEDIVTSETDVESMIRVIRSNKTIGVVGGHINKKKKTEGRVLKTEEGDTFIDVKTIDRFMMIYTDVTLSVRFSDTAEDFALDFCTRAGKRLPYKITLTDSTIKSNKDYDNEENDEQSDGKDTGATPGSDVPDPAGGSDAEGGSDLDSSSSRENETGEDPVTSRG